MRVAKGHTRPAMPEQPRDHRQGHALHDRIARERMSKVVQAHVLDPRLPANLAPHRKLARPAPGGIHQRGEDVRACRLGLTCENRLGLRVQKDGTWTRFAVPQVKGVPVDLRPAQVHELALPAPGQQQQSDDLHLLSARASSAVGIQRHLQSVDLVTRKEPGPRRPGIVLHAPSRIDGQSPANDGMVQYLPQHIQRAVRPCRCRPAVAVEPLLYGRSSDPVDRCGSEARKQLRSEHAVHALAGRRFAAVVAGGLPRHLNEVLKRRRHHHLDSSTAPTVSTASRAISSAKWVYLRVVDGSR